MITLNDVSGEVLLRVINNILQKMKEDNAHGEINIVVVDGEVKFINETYKNKY